MIDREMVPDTESFEECRKVLMGTPLWAKVQVIDQKVRDADSLIAETKKVRAQQMKQIGKLMAGG